MSNRTFENIIVIADPAERDDDHLRPLLERMVLTQDAEDRNLITDMMKRAYAHMICVCEAPEEFDFSLRPNLRCDKCRIETALLLVRATA